MAEAKKTYPMLGVAVWWKLREQFQKSLPGNVSRSYLATVLGIEERSAGNLVGPLRTLGLVQEDGKPTERANHWRFDEDYPQVCKDIREDVYPRELLDAIPDAAANREGVIRWFMRAAGVGEAGAKKMAATYELLTDADPTKAPDARETSKGAARSKKGAARQKPSRPDPKPSYRSEAPAAAPAVSAGSAHPASPSSPLAQTVPASSVVAGPSIHIDLQVHISADASADQIDHIFASMARHLYGKK